MSPITILVREDGAWRWRMNLPVIGKTIDDLMDFPPVPRGQFPGPAQFIYGTASNYVQGSHLAVIKQLFPLARLRAIADAGHWVYVDQPDAFVKVWSGFLA